MTLYPYQDPPEQEADVDEVTDIANHALNCECSLCRLENGLEDDIVEDYTEDCEPDHECDCGFGGFDCIVCDGRDDEPTQDEIDGYTRDYCAWISDRANKD